MALVIWSQTCGQVIFNFILNITVGLKKQVVTYTAPLELKSVNRSSTGVNLLVKDVGGALDQTSSELSPIRQKSWPVDWYGLNVSHHVYF